MDKATKWTGIVSVCFLIVSVGSIIAAAPKPVATAPIPKPASASADRLTASEEDTLAKFARDRGYICNHVRNSRRTLSEPGVSLYCESWVYDFHQRGGRWAITARKGWGQ